MFLRFPFFTKVTLKISNQMWKHYPEDIGMNKDWNRMVFSIFMFFVKITSGFKGKKVGKDLLYSKYFFITGEKRFVEYNKCFSIRGQVEKYYLYIKSNEEKKSNAWFSSVGKIWKNEKILFISFREWQGIAQRFYWV